jgi:hypothetical protein
VLVLGVALGFMLLDSSGDSPEELSRHKETLLVAVPPTKIHRRAALSYPCRCELGNGGLCVGVLFALTSQTICDV